MDQTNETRSSLSEKEKRILAEREANKGGIILCAQRMSEATQRILEVRSELHLTWWEFEEVLRHIKQFAYIYSIPLGQSTKEQPLKFWPIDSFFKSGELLSGQIKNAPSSDDGT